jgi:hypothetical protein
LGQLSKLPVFQKIIKLKNLIKFNKELTPNINLAQSRNQFQFGPKLNRDPKTKQPDNYIGLSKKN